MRQRFICLACGFIATFGLACRQPSPEVGPNVVFVTATPDNNIAVQALPTATSTAPTMVTLPPTTTAVTLATVTPPAPAAPAAEQLQFAAGATAATTEGTLLPNGLKRYVVRAMADQWMQVNVSSPNSAAKLAIYGTDGGNPLLQVTSNVDTWQGFLPSTQDYVIDVISTNLNADISYTLGVAIPERVQFAAGTTATQLSGQMGHNQIHAYILRAQAGQAMEVIVSPPNGRFLLAVHGVQDGQPLLSHAAQATSWFGTLPASQDYLVQVMGNGGGNYTLDIIIDPIASIPEQPGETLPTPVQFGLGETAAVINDTLFPNGIDVYSLRAFAGQAMLAQLTSTDGSARLRIEGETSGSTLVDGLQNGATQWRGKLPSDQLYLVQAMATNSVANIPYTLEIIIPELIRFDSGAISADRTEEVADNQTHTYILQASAGQVMEAHITPPNGNVWLEVSGFSDGQMLQPATGATSWSGTLPASQEYLIKTVGNGGGAYNLQVIIR